jgi:hypothetical protein
VTATKLFIIRKYIIAKSAADAIKKDRKTPPDDVWMDEDWRKENLAKQAEQAVGFGAQDKPKAKKHVRKR